MIKETYILLALWPIHDHWIERHEAATDKATCEIAAYDATQGIALPLDVDGAAQWARCVPGNLFKPGWDVIKGFNDR